jgi:6-hydroxycyclohex-1-ene-1-carbonyl-CoA dehydrogenase
MQFAKIRIPVPIYVIKAGLDLLKIKDRKSATGKIPKVEFHRENHPMVQAPTRWLMTAKGEPFIQAAFDPLPLKDDEVLVEIAGCGVCHTDLGYYYDGIRTNHSLPLALGHEISGRVVDAAPDAYYWIDKTVIVPAVIPCGKCDACRRGRPTICPHQKMPGNDIHGGFATHIVVPARGLCVVDEDRLKESGIDLADLSVVADAVTTPYQAVIQAGVTKGDFVVVNGAGGIGGYAVQIASALGATVVAVDVSPEKLAAASEGGASLALNAREFSARDLKSKIAEFAKGQGFRQTEWIIFECSGTRVGQETAFSLLNHGATLCIVGFTMEKCEVRLSNLMAFHARAIGNWGCPPEHYPAALDLVLAGRVKVSPFVEKHPLRDINRIFEVAHSGALKRRAVLVPHA